MKVSVIGAGKVGAESAFLLAQEPKVSKIVLVDILKDLAMGEALDIEYSMGKNGGIRVYSGDYHATEGSDVIVVCAGLARKPGMAREDLLGKNEKILKTIIDSTLKLSPSAFYLIVTNPVDLLTFKAVELGISRTKVAGVGTYHDTLRLQSILKKHGFAGSKSIILGVHGEGAYIIREKIDDKLLKAVKEEVDTAGPTILKLKKATFYGIAVAVRDTFRALSGGKIVASVVLDGEYGLSGAALGVVCNFKNLTLDSVDEVELGEAKESFFSSAKKQSTFLS